MPKFAVIVPILLLLAGCATTLDKQQAQLKPSVVAQLPSHPTTLERGDTIDIQRVDDDKVQRAVIRPDGNISYPNAGSVKLAGLTPEQAAKRLEEKLSERLQAPEVVINVIDAPGNRAFVGGEVNRQGAIDLKGGITLQQAIFLSSGINSSGDKENVVLLRQASESSSHNMYLINLNTVLSGGTAQPYAVWLQRGDIVFVPRSGIGEWIQLVEHINKSIPFNPSISGFYNLRPEQR